MGSDQGFIAGPRRLGRRDAKDNRLFVEAVLYRYRTGIPWRDLPERFGDFRVVHTRFSRWAKSGVWQRIFKQLALDADNEYAMIDATIVRAHQHSAGAKKSRRRRRRRPGDRTQQRRIEHEKFTLSSMPWAIRLAFI